MFTLKIKVLSIYSNKLLWRSVRQSVLIWLCTGITGCTLVHALFGQPLVIESYGLSLLYSSPAIAIAAPVLYFLPRFQSTPARVGFALFSILATCCLIIGVFIFLSENSGLVILALSPFVPSAIIWFFLIAGEQTLYPNKPTYQ